MRQVQTTSCRLVRHVDAVTSAAAPTAPKTATLGESHHPLAALASPRQVEEAAKIGAALLD